MAGMTKSRELFLHELGDVLYAERQLVKTLPRLAREATDSELRKGFEKHLKETEAHVENLKQVFSALGERPRGEQCPGIDGIRAEHDQFMKEEQPSPQIRDLFLTGAAARTEHYEIAAYTGLVTMARSLKQPDAVRLLQANLREEKEALKKVEATAKRLGKEHGDGNGSGVTPSSKRRRARTTG